MRRNLVNAARRAEDAGDDTDSLAAIDEGVRGALSMLRDTGAPDGAACHTSRMRAPIAHALCCVAPRRCAESAMLHRLLLLLSRIAAAPNNRMTARNVAVVFAPTLMRASDAAAALVESELEIAAVEMLVERFEHLYPTPYEPLSPDANDDDADADALPLASFRCRWKKRDGKIHIHESMIV